MSGEVIVRRKRFSEELEALKASIVEMSRLAAIAVKNSVKSLIEQDVKLADNVIGEDKKIDELEIEIENTCLRLIALQQPMAGDLRTIGACFKIVTDLERIGDRAEDIAVIAKQLSGRPPIKPYIDIPKMTKLSVEMIGDSIVAFRTRDTRLALDLGRRDDEVDTLFRQVMNELFPIVKGDPRRINDIARVLFVASYLERIADHTTNIAERVIYMVQGKRVKIN